MIKQISSYQVRTKSSNSSISDRSIERSLPHEQECESKIPDEACTVEISPEARRLAAEERLAEEHECE